MPCAMGSNPIISVVFFDDLYHYHVADGNTVLAKFALDETAHQALKAQQQLADSYSSEAPALHGDPVRLSELG